MSDFTRQGLNNDSRGSSCIITRRSQCDDCEQIKKIGNWKIELIPDNDFIEENNYPDWYGYQKIDGI